MTIPVIDFSWNLDLVALITAVGVIVSLLGLIWQVRKQRLQHSADIITSLTERYESGSMRAYRKQFATVLINERNPSENELEKMRAGYFSKSLGFADLPVLGFFENLALLTRKGVIDKEMVWCKFGGRVAGWYQSTEKLINQARMNLKDPTLWEEFEWLYKRTSKTHWFIQRINKPMFLRGMVFSMSQIAPIVKGNKMTEKEIEDFLKQESNLGENKSSDYQILLDRKATPKKLKK